ncbi:serine hydrolase [Limosilactobacillus mucosae]|uniref:Serine hydrolase n=2 Tax=Limosilactobacillus mucosae TaxID=97478 RepID=A0AAJ1HVU5_LIMMU|nr:serine hydrolase [Limosilactobacillus mucosae]MDC2830480.1 serine hydrolase [Limosilactobacillus mucosae]MDC2838055.1 serine hydrolase [Limosilactobacillus mucosae]MDC2850205.1 serine hydrolase [Limosilactobacillus mucosae]MDC2854204.1 serine hydrolase [Limosilactobacillus mucosae]
MNRHSWKKCLQNLVLVLLSLNLSLLGLSSMVLADGEATEESTVVAQDSSSDTNGHQSGQNVGTSQDVDAKAAIAMDAKTGQILYQKNARKRYPVASTIKILTLAVIEKDIQAHKLSWDQKVTISHPVAVMANDWRFSNVPLNEGESYTIKSLVDSMMLVSADGSAEALALADAGSVAKFNTKMQQVAKEAGVTDAKIYNMIGLENGDLGTLRLKNVSKHAENQISAVDLAKIASWLLNHYPDVVNITKTAQEDFPVSASQTYHMQNINLMIKGAALDRADGEIDGLKTGMTDSAGNCFVSTGTFNNRRLVTVVLNVPGDFNNQFQQTNNLYNRVLGRFTPQTIKKGTLIKVGQKKARVAKTTTLWLPKDTKLSKKTVKIKGTLKESTLTPNDMPQVALKLK